MTRRCSRIQQRLQIVRRDLQDIKDCFGEGDSTSAGKADKCHEEGNIEAHLGVDVETSWTRCTVFDPCDPCSWSFPGLLLRTEFSLGRRCSASVRFVLWKLGGKLVYHSACFNHMFKKLSSSMGRPLLLETNQLLHSCFFRRRVCVQAEPKNSSMGFFSPHEFMILSQRYFQERPMFILADYYCADLHRWLQKRWFSPFWFQHSTFTGAKAERFYLSGHK